MIKKKGQIESFTLIVISIFIIAMFIFLYNTVFTEIYEGFRVSVDASQGNTSYAATAIRDIENTESSVWDYSVLAIMFGFFLSMILLSITTSVSPVFYFVYIFASVGSFLMGIIMTTIWRTWAENPEFAGTVARFPITNLMLGSYWPSIMTIIFFIVLIVLFGKRPDGGVVR